MLLQITELILINLTPRRCSLSLILTKSIKNNSFYKQSKIPLKYQTQLFTTKQTAADIYAYQITNN